MTLWCTGRISAWAVTITLSWDAAGSGKVLVTGVVIRLCSLVLAGRPSSQSPAWNSAHVHCAKLDPSNLTPLHFGIFCFVFIDFIGQYRCQVHSSSAHHLYPVFGVCVLFSIEEVNLKIAPVS